MIRVAILQPSYLPWIGYFDQIYKSDIFVIYDDVQYDKHGWRNRNRIKALDTSIWLTVPVKTKNQNKPLNNTVLIDNNVPWRRRHLNSLTTYYSRAPYFHENFPKIADVIDQEHALLINLNTDLLTVLTEILGIQRKIILSSELGVTGNKTEKIIKICQELGATNYLTGDSAKDYLVTEDFTRNNIQLEFHEYRHPVYTQTGGGEFIPFMSIVDLIFNMGKTSLSTLNEI